MSLRVDTSSLISGALVCGNRGLGVLGADIPSAGDNGAGYAYNDLSLPADSSNEICGRITSWPSAGDLYADEDTSFEFSGAPDGSYTFSYQLYVDGVATGSPETVYLQVGPYLITAANSQQINQASAAAVLQASAGDILVAGSQQSNQCSSTAIIQTHLIACANSQQVNDASTCSATEVGATTLTSADISAIVAAIFAQAQMTPIHSDGLTLKQFIALK